MVLRALPSDINMQITRQKSTTRRTFKCLQTGNPESRISNNALADYCLLYDRTQIAQIVIFKLNTHAFMDQNLAVIVFLQILMWTLSKTPLKIYRERNSLPNSGCYESKRISMYVYYIYTFVMLTFRTEVRWRIQDDILLATQSTLLA